MNRQTYHYIGDAQGDTRTGEGVMIAGVELGGIVRTRLHACESCGSVVSEGRGQAVHDTWHQNMDELFSGRPRWATPGWR